MKLEGLRVIDMSQFLPGPHLTMMMADHGADVIKIENTKEGEPTRHIGLHKDGMTVYFRNTQRGKRSMTLDLKTDAGREVLFKLAETADVLVESFRPGVVDKLGVGYKAISARAPRIVYCSISAFGQEGRYRHRPAHDLSVQAYAGMAALNQDAQGTPVHPNMPGADILGSCMSLSGILMALLRRQQTGQGDYVDISMFNSLVSWTCNVTGPVFAEGRSPIPKLERTMGGAALYQIYRTKDERFITLGGSEIKFAENLLTALGRPDLIDACRQPPGTVQYPVMDFLRGAFAEKTQAEWEQWFDDKDVCFGPVRHLHEAYADPFMTESGMLLHDEQGNEHINNPIRFSKEPHRVNFHAPGQGEHSAEILRSLGYDEQTINAFKKQGVC